MSIPIFQFTTPLLIKGNCSRKNKYHFSPLSPQHHCFLNVIFDAKQIPILIFQSTTPMLFEGNV